MAEAEGCEQCVGGGHLGRTGVGEWLTPTPATATALQEHRPAADIARTLPVIVSARAAVIELLRERRISLGELRRLCELTSVQLPENNDGK